MNQAKSINIRRSSEYILIGLFVWSALQTIIANYSLYYSYGLWLLSLICMVFFFQMCGSRILSKDKKSALYYLIAFGFPYTISTVVNGCIPSKTYFFYLFYGIFFLLLKKQYQIKVVSYFSWALSFLLLVSLIEYVVYQFFHLGIIVTQVVRESSIRGGSFYHLLFNLTPTYSNFSRFQSIAEEPGLVGTLCGILLFYTGRYRSLRFPFIIFIICGLFSFSLAFYAILILYLCSGLFKVKTTIVMILTLFVMGSITSQYLEELIFIRIDKESITEMDNRTTATFDARFYQAWEGGQLWFGVGSNNLPSDITYGVSNRQGGNAGAKKWIFEYGIVSFVVLFICSLKLYYRQRGEKLSFYDAFFLIVFWLSFYQRHTIAESYTLMAFCAVPLGEYVRAKQIL